MEEGRGGGAGSCNAAEAMGGADLACVFGTLGPGSLGRAEAWSRRARNSCCICCSSVRCAPVQQSRLNWSAAGISPACLESCPPCPIANA